MIAIGLHKYAEAMSLSISLQRAFKDDFKTLFWLLFIFAFATPLGIAMGLILSKANEIITVVFTSLAGGTFLYISCSELIVEEFSLPGGRWFKLLAFMCGAAIITSLWFLDK
jgi:zinc transporter ZupT